MWKELNNNKPYIVAELNSSHRGKVDIAKRMIDAAKLCGCNAVKFQSWTPESLYCKNYYDENPIARRMVKGFSLTSENLRELAVYCRGKNIGFSSTPYCREEVDFMVDECCPAFIKVASMDINNLPFLRYIAQKALPVVLSTGMATMDEIDRAVKEIAEAGNEEICILHCVSLYPAEPAVINLNNIITLRERFARYKIGYSDHTLGSEVACAAVALGAVLIEKHFSLDASQIGWDNQMATEPDEMEQLVRQCRNVGVALGNYNRVVDNLELEQRKKMRRSVVAAHKLVSGQVICFEELDAKRPGSGISVSDYGTVIGRRVIKDVEKDELILEEFLSD